MNSHQLNGLSSLLDTLTGVASGGIVLYPDGKGGITVSVDDQPTGLLLYFDVAEGAYVAVART